MYWNPEVLTRIDAADDLKIAPYHPDMNTTGTPTWIWEVKVDNRLFVRAYSGIRSKWYQAALSQQAGKILAIGQEFDVLFAKPSDPELESKIDQAYLKKYSGSSYVSAMTGIRARAATIEILPLPGKPALRQRGTSRKPAWPPRGSVWSRLTRRWIVSPSKRDLAAVLTCDACLRNSLTSLQVNIVNDFTVAKWRKVILFCHLRHNPSVLL